jgi:hypothetical protein
MKGRKKRKHLDALMDAAVARIRRGEDAEHESEMRELNAAVKAAQDKLPKRELSQLKFTEQHWWREAKYWDEKSENVSIEEEKASMWYEATRRRPEVQQAWIEGKFSFGDNGWQHFTGWVVINLLRSWPELDPLTKNGIIKSSYSHWSVPPEGYSTFPTNKAEQRKVSAQVLHLPESNDPDAAQRFVEHARRFADAGFLIVAVDRKQNQAVRAACESIEVLPPTFRKADLKPVMFHHLPPDISEADRLALDEKQRHGTLTDQDFEELRRKYIKPTSNLHAPLIKTAEVQERVFHKRKKLGKLIEEKLFSFRDICRQLEAFDNGAVSDFVNAVRL